MADRDQRWRTGQAGRPSAHLRDTDLFEGSDSPTVLNIHTGWSLPATPGPPFNFSTFALQEDDDGEDYGQPTHLEVKLEQPDFKTEHTSPEPDQTEPVDLSLNKPRSSSAQVSKSSATVNPAPSSTQPGLSATPVPSTVQSIGSMVTEPPPFPTESATNEPRINSTLLSPPPPPRFSLQGRSWPLRAPAASRSST